MLNKKHRLTKRKEFGYIYKLGKRVHVGELSLIFIPTKLENARFGFVVSKKVGKAHERNKVKRQLSEIVRLNIDKFNSSYNYIFVTKPEIVNLNYFAKQEKMFELIKKAHLSMKQ